MLKLFSPAKINLVLEVTGKRDDGFHEIKSIVQAVNLYDQMIFEHSSDDNLNCSNDKLIPDNIVMHAVRLLKQETGYGNGVSIKLEKHIPVSAGLGGGSSNAATALLGLNQLWELNLHNDKLLELAAKLGSDVPFFLYKGTALMEGRGEIVTTLPPLKNVWIVLLVYGQETVEEKTRVLYSSLTPQFFTGGNYTAAGTEYIKKHGNFNKSLLYNVFDNIALKVFSDLEKYKDYFYKAGADNVHIAGSGPALFSLVDEKEKATIISNNLKNVYKSYSLVVEPYTSESEFGN